MSEQGSGGFIARMATARFLARQIVGCQGGVESVGAPCPSFRGRNAQRQRNIVAALGKCDENARIALHLPHVFYPRTVLPSPIAAVAD